MRTGTYNTNAVTKPLIGFTEPFTQNPLIKFK